MNEKSLLHSPFQGSLRVLKGEWYEDAHFTVILSKSGKFVFVVNHFEQELQYTRFFHKKHETEIRQIFFKKHGQAQLHRQTQKQVFTMFVDLTVSFKIHF